jgi:hypothetical protein
MRLEEKVEKMAKKLPQSDVLLFIQFPFNLNGKLRCHFKGLTNEQVAEVIKCLRNKLPWRDPRLLELGEEYGVWSGAQLPAASSNGSLVASASSLHGMYTAPWQS